jgi:hypothetical protein
MLGKVSPLTTNNVLLYKVPTGKSAVITVALTNRTGGQLQTTLSLIKADDLGIESVTMTDIGDNLSSIPTLTVTGSGTGASLTVNELQLTQLSLSNIGQGYTVGNILDLVGGTASVVARITVNAVDGNGGITSFSINNTVPSRYTALIAGENASLTGGTGTSAQALVSSIRYGIATVTIAAAGNDYAETPTVSASSGSGFVFSLQMTTAAVQPVDAIEYETVIPGNGVLERSAITLRAGESVFVKSSQADALNAFVFGVEAIA